MPPNGPLRGAGKTALGVAMIRARESRRDDRLFDDPYAQAFADASAGAFPGEPETGEQLAAPGRWHRWERCSTPTSSSARGSSTST